MGLAKNVKIGLLEVGAKMLVKKEKHATGDLAGQVRDGLLRAGQDFIKNSDKKDDTAMINVGQSSSIVSDARDEFNKHVMRQCDNDWIITDANTEDDDDNDDISSIVTLDT